MTTRPSLTWTGVTEFVRGLRKTAAATQSELKGTAVSGAHRIERAAQGRIRVVTGKTRDAIRVRLTDRGAVAEVQPVPGRPPMLAVWIEYGTVRQPARPFFGPAVDAERKEFAREAEAATERAFREGGL